MMANMIVSTNARDTRRKKGQAAAQFLQQHALGLVARLTEVINDSVSARPSVQERNRSIGAMEEMIRIGREHIRIARPQASHWLHPS